MPSFGDIGKIVDDLKSKIPFVGKGGSRKPSFEKSERPLLAYFVVRELEDNNASINRENVQQAFRVATRTLQTAGYIKKGVHEPTPAGKKALQALRQRDDYKKIQNKYGRILKKIRTSQKEGVEPIYGGEIDFLMESEGEGKSMVAVYPPRKLAQKVARFASGGINTDNLHVTIVYLGKRNEAELQSIAGVVRSACRRVEPMDLSVEGSGCFLNDDATVRHLLVGGPGFEELRYRVHKALRSEDLIDEPRHGWIPHMTLGYEDGRLEDGWEEAANIEDDDWLCQYVYVVRDDDVIDKIPLKGV